MLVLGESEIISVLDRDELIEAVGRSLADLSTGMASMPPRIAATVSERNALLLAMPAHLPGEQVLGAKLVSVFPGNQAFPGPLIMRWWSSSIKKQESRKHFLTAAFSLRNGPLQSLPSPPPACWRALEAR